LSFKDLVLKQNYESGIDDLVNDFYNPVLQKAKQYDRIAGFFSSSSLAIAAKGIAGLIKNDGKMRIIASPRLSKNDIETIEDVNKDPKKYLEKILINDFANIENDISKHHIFALGWLLANNLLEIKIAVIIKDGSICLDPVEIEEAALFHQKVGILRDTEENTISFSGSINETSAAWLKNVEEFKVFKSWISGQKEYCQNDQIKFQDFWENKRKNVRTFDLPEAVKNKLLEKIPPNKEEVLRLLEINNMKSKNKLNLFFYQKNALQKWNDNNRRLICEMATGTGKTRVALACIADLLAEKKKLAVFVACPQNTLSLQWKKEIEKMNITFENSIIADSTNKNWKIDLEKILLDISLNKSKNVIVYTTHQTNSSEKFMSILTNFKNKTEFFLIGDEAHGLGADKSKRGLKNYYDFRLALSATPKRWFDDEGTKNLYEFFGNVIFEFTIKDALNTINPLTNKPFLVQYDYFPYFISLTEDELDEYNKLTKKIGKFSSYKNSSESYKKTYENFIFMRANIVKNAENKYAKFIEIIDEMENIEDLLIFVSPKQLPRIIMILSDRDIKCSKITEKEGTVPKMKFEGLTERQYIINQFKNKQLKSLVAIKCLDEGIDIPTAKKAILLSNSSNPREYVQRIGRVLRQSKTKSRATIIDFIVKPVETENKTTNLIEKQIFEKEKIRIIEIATNAINNAEAIQNIYKI